MSFTASPLQDIGPKNATVLVLGGGPIGLAVVQCLVAQGTKKIIVSEVAASRLAFAKEFGAHHVLDPRTYDTVGVSRELSGGSGPDIAFDCAVRLPPMYIAARVLTIYRAWSQVWRRHAIPSGPVAPL